MLYKSEKRNTGSSQLLTLSIASACLLLAACSDNKNPDEELLSLVSAAGLTGDPTTGRTLPAINDPKAQLGKKLFFTKGLGGNDDSACVTCHHPSLGGGDDLSLSIGVGAETPDLLGPGRFHDLQAVLDDGGEFDGGPPVPRNTPTTFNIAMWDQAPASVTSSRPRASLGSHSTWRATSGTSAAGPAHRLPAAAPSTAANQKSWNAMKLATGCTF